MRHGYCPMVRPATADDTSVVSKTDVPAGPCADYVYPEHRTPVARREPWGDAVQHVPVFGQFQRRGR